jgi:hypothetical protein
MMDLFDLIILAFTSLVLVSIALGSISVCVAKCIHARRSRIGPSEEEEGRKDQQQQRQMPRNQQNPHQVIINNKKLNAQEKQQDQDGRQVI